MSDDELPSGRATYRHGGLHDALLEAGIEMAREGGPDAVVLREATRRAGVSPNAAYRHFADREALLKAVSDCCLGFSADRIERELAALPGGGTGTGNTGGAGGTGGGGLTEADARAMLRAVGRGYLAFAREEPGLFRTAYSVPDDLSRATEASKAGRGGRTPFQLVGVALDAMVETGAMPAARRQNAEFLAWATVHGLGMLIIDGPLRGLDDRMVDFAISRLLDMVDRGL